MGRRKKKRSKQKNSWNWPWVFNYGDKRNLTRTELMEKLMPLIHSFKRVDTMAEKFRGGGGCIGDLQELNKILSERIEIQKKLSL